MTAAFKIDKIDTRHWQARFGNRFSYYDVSDQIGTMIVRPGAVDSFDMHGIHLGRFKSLRAARTAIEILTKSLRAARAYDSHDGGGL
jgi:hypothetical protein